MQSKQPAGRGRRVKPPSMPSLGSPGVSFAAHVIKKARMNGQMQPVASLSVMDRVQILAAREFGDAGSMGVAKLAKVSQAAADSLIVGSKPVTDRVLASVARTAQASGHWLLLGEGSMNPEPSLPEDEMRFIQAMRKVDEAGALLMLFVLDFGAVLDAVPREERLRVLAAVRRIAHDAESCQFLSAVLGDGFVNTLRGNLAQAMFQRAVSPEQLMDQPHLFTPMDELLGAFGPERGRSLMNMLAA